MKRNFKIMGLLVFLFINILTLTACAKTATQSKKTEGKDVASSTNSVSNEKKTYGIGDKITFEGKAEYTITNVEWTEERNQFEQSNPEKVLKVTYNVTNLSDKDAVVGMGMDWYVGGKKMETYANSNTTETISAGRSYEGAVQHFGVNGSGSKELEIKPFMDFSGTKPAIVTFELD